MGYDLQSSPLLEENRSSNKGAEYQDVRVQVAELFKTCTGFLGAIDKTRAKKESGTLPDLQK